MLHKAGYWTSGVYGVCQFVLIYFKGCNHLGWFKSKPCGDMIERELSGKWMLLNDMQMYALYV